MFGHLKAEEFVNLIEGIELSAKRRSHLDSCGRCSATWTSMLAVHAGISSLDADIPEPDWAQFRSSVRDQLLSRSAQRASALRRWTGWPIRPAMAWGLSLLVAVGVTTGAFLWISERMQEPGTVSVTLPLEPAPVLTEVEAQEPVWSQTALFDDLIQLGDTEGEQLRLMLETEQKGRQYSQ